MERKHGRARLVRVFNRGIVSEENLQRARRRGASYLVGTPPRTAQSLQRRLLEGDWHLSLARSRSNSSLRTIAKPTFWLAAERRRRKETAMRSRVVRGLTRDLIRLRRLLRRGQFKTRQGSLHLGISISSYKGQNFGARAKFERLETNSISRITAAASALRVAC